MNCLCCGKPILTDDKSLSWHKSCIKRFFGTKELPEIDIDDQTLEEIASKNTHMGFTIPGVQKKLSLHLFSKNNQNRLTLVHYPTGYILKPQVSDFTALPEAEHLVMSMANIAGISTVPHALLFKNNNYAYITKRVDRIFEKDNIKMLAMEDFCQLDLRLTQDKYKGSYERCAKIIQKYSSQKKLDLTELFIRLVFCYIVGNSDMHLKNFSLIETSEGSSQYILSPAHDLLPVNVIMPEDTEQFALTMNGRKIKLRKKDFILFAEKCDISKISAEKMIKKLVLLEPKLITMCQESLLPEDLKESFITLIQERIQIFK